MRMLTRLLNTLKNLPKFFVAAPVLSYRDGRPISSFNQLQFRVHRELCVKQANEALQHCRPDERRGQRAVLTAYFGAAF
jgi:hypothetical protein